jgi:hypothetical protein
LWFGNGVATAPPTGTPPYHRRHLTNTSSTSPAARRPPHATARRTPHGSKL